MKKVLLALCPILFLGLTACKSSSSPSDGDNVKTFSCSPAYKNVALEGEEFSVNINAEGNWFVDMMETASWVNVFPLQGRGNAEVLVTVDKGTAATTTLLFVSEKGEQAKLTIGRGVNVVPEVEIDGDGFLTGVFSVGSGKRVRFSRGNLQYHATAGTHATADNEEAAGVWRFANNQWDVIGAANSNIAEDYNGWIDLFAWGTSGYDNTLLDRYAANFEPWSTSDTVMFEEYNTYGYGPSMNQGDVNLTGNSRYFDWGVYNAISNGKNQIGQWRTLTADEWRYLLNGRSNAEDLRGQATVMGVHGYVLFPDGTNIAALGFTPNPNDWNTNLATSAQIWQMWENEGAVFLPCAGRRYGTAVENVTSWGIYWSSTADDQQSAKGIGFFESYGFSYVSYLRYRAFSVRLVQNY